MVGSAAGARSADGMESVAWETLSDRQLLVRYRAGSQAAFSELVRRHAGLVLGVCQRVLGRADGVEDAFQAAFLVLARKARSLEWHDSVAGWLHQTARRTALKLRGTIVRRRDVEGRAARGRTEVVETPTADPAGQAALRELGEILDAELDALPARLREVILLSQVQGLTRDETADRLGISVAAVKDRLERARERLRSRLARRGVGLSSAVLAAWLTPGSAEASGLTTLAASTSHAAGAFATGSWAAGTSPTAATLAQGVLKMMGFEKMRSVAVWIVSILTAGGVAYGMLRDDPTRFEQGLRGRIVAVRPGGPSTVTVSLDEFGTLLNLDVAPQVRVWTAFEPGRLDDLKEGQYVSLRLADDHRTVNEIHVQGPVREASIRSVDASGKLVIVDSDDDEEGGGATREVELAPDAILRIGGLPAARDELRPGMQVPLEFGKDGKRVHAIEAEAAENRLIDGRLVEVAAGGDGLVVSREAEEGEGAAEIRQSLAVSAETPVTLDGKPAKLADLRPGSTLKLRLADDGRTIRAIQAVAPEADDDGETQAAVEK